jgi:peptide-methionine (R)-S-oxide reductase
MPERILKTDDEWKELLTREQYRVLREKGTELPDSGEYYRFRKDGVFLCSACGNELFSSETKFESGSGWPSFWEVVGRDSVTTAPDRSLERERTEVLCARCGGHLGHLFADGPDPTGMRYCVNSVSLEFKEEE